MSTCKRQILADGHDIVPRTCPVHGIAGCPEPILHRSECSPMSGEVLGFLAPKSRPTKLYLAATFDSRPQMEETANLLKARGFEITSKWVYGGEEGLTREQIAIIDLEDVDAADAVVSFTYPRGTMTSGGGRHVEFGYALARGKRLIVIGARENVFHHAPGVELYPTLDDWLLSC